MRALMVCALPAILVATAVLVPFLDKAFTIDDLTFLVEAEHALEDPLHPSAVELVFEGVRARISAGIVSGPVMAYLLVPVVLRGGSEWLAHLEMLGLLLIAVLATIALALRLGLDRRGAILAGLFLVTSPVVLGMSSTAMPDVPAMSLGVLGVERLLAWRRDRRWHQALAAAVALALAVLARPHLLLLWAPAALLLLDDGPWVKGWWRPLVRPGLRFAPLVLGAVLVVLAVYVSRDVTSQDDLVRTTMRRIEAGEILSNLMAFLVHWAFALPLAPAWLLLVGKRLPAWRIVLLVLAAVGIAGSLAGQWRLLLIPLCAVCLDVLVDVHRDAWQRRDAAALAACLWLLIALPAALYAHLPSKYLVPSVPAAALLVGKACAGASRRRVLALGGLVLVPSLVLGILILRADRALAEVGRLGGQVVAREVARGERVWCDGAWAFQWYAMQAGATVLSEDPPDPKPGDIVVFGPRGKRIERITRKRLLERRSFAEPGGRVLGGGAGFYSNGYGYLPWSWSREEYAALEVWRVEP